MSGMDGDYGGSMDGNIEHTKVKGEVRMDRDIFEKASVFNGGVQVAAPVHDPKPEAEPVPEDKLGIVQLKADVKNFSLEPEPTTKPFDNFKRRTNEPLSYNSI